MRKKRLIHNSSNFSVFKLFHVNSLSIIIIDHSILRIAAMWEQEQEELRAKKREEKRFFWEFAAPLLGWSTSSEKRAEKAPNSKKRRLVSLFELFYCSAASLLSIAQFFGFCFCHFSGKCRRDAMAKGFFENKWQKVIQLMPEPFYGLWRAPPQFNLPLFEPLRIPLPPVPQTRPVSRNLIRFAYRFIPSQALVISQAGVLKSGIN